MEIINKRIIIIGLITTVVAVVMIVKMILICLSHGSDIRDSVESKAFSQMVITSFGGNIYGNNDSDLLAHYYPYSDIYWNAKVAKSLESENPTLDIVDILTYNFDSCFLDKNGGKSYKSIIKSAYDNDETYRLIMHNAIYEEEQRIRSFPVLRKSKGGLSIERHVMMKYTSKKIGTRTIGKRDFDEAMKQKVGLIGAYGDTLKGKSKTIDVFHGNIVPTKVSEDLYPKKGKDLITTIDYNLSELSYNVLYNKMQEVDAKRGCVIIMDVKTGDVLTMINLSGEKVLDEYSNVAFGYSYEPGSVFKLASYLVAIKDNVIDIDDKINIGKGIMTFPGNKDVTDTHLYSTDQIMSVKELFAISSNVGAAKLIYDAYKNNPQKFVDGLHKLHLDDTILCDVLTHTYPTIKNTNSGEWWQTSLYQMAQGYEVMMTSIRLAMLFNAVANNGVMMKPRFVKEIVSNNDDEDVYFNPVVIDTICSPAVAKKVQCLLREVVTSGTAEEVFKDVKYNFSGKTGTAQISANTIYNASFAGFMPSENPKYTIYVMLSELEGVYYASKVAAPVAKEIADKIFTLDHDFYVSLHANTNTPFVWQHLNNN